MKKVYILIIMIWFSTSVFSQTPQAFKYQAIARNGNGEPLENQPVTVRTSILAGSNSGDVNYTEIHDVVTKTLGLFDLEIGNGTEVISGSFENIAWGAGAYFLKIEIDPDGGDDFELMGISQLISVPYVRYAERSRYSSHGIPAMTEEERDALIDPAVGMQIYNTTSNCLNFFNGISWFETCGDCTPQPSQANAGIDQFFTNANTTTVLAANTPEKGTGMWSVISGEGATFEDLHNPATVFNGQACADYLLAWTITTSCGSSSDQVTIKFFHQPTVPDAGPDQIGIGGNSITLAGNTPTEGVGLWQIVAGSGGSLGDPTSPNSTFNGMPGINYLLTWTISTICTSLVDTVAIRFWDCGDLFIDARDGKNYITVQIGNQCWMAQNLNTGNKITGTANASNNGTIEKYCYNDTETNCNTYGGMYQWDEMMSYITTPGVQGICMSGWHLPTDTEQTALNTYLNTQAAYKCNSTADYTAKSLAAKTNWNTSTSTCAVGNNLSANNATGFTALPGGRRNIDGSFSMLGDYVAFWSSTHNVSANNSRYLRLFRDYASVLQASYEKLYGMYVRCIKDDTTFQLTVAPDNWDVTGDSGTTSFAVTSNTTWWISESVSWLTVTPMNGTNNGTLTVDFQANPLSTPRVGQITIISGSGTLMVNVTVTQATDWSCGVQFTDERDNKTYTSVQIGNVCWMAQNLNTGNMINGTANASNNGTIEKYCYNNTETNCDVYGGMYQWNEMMNYSATPGYSVQGICPEGWYLPTDASWTVLTSVLEGLGVAGGKMKETGTTHWLAPNTGATNSSGFTGLPGGERTSLGNFYSLGTYGIWWSSSSYSSTYAWTRHLQHDNPYVGRNHNNNEHGYGVRCWRGL